MDAAAVLGAVGTLVGLVRALPQLLRLITTRDAHGVSLDTAATSSVVSFGWATYGVLTSQVPVTLATGSSGVVFASITVLALKLGRRPGELRTAPVWLVVLVAVTALAQEDGLAVLLPVSVLVANVPQLVVAYREPDLTGLSPSTWLLSVSDGMVWAAYALVTGDTAILVFGILQLTTSVRGDVATRHQAHDFTKIVCIRAPFQSTLALQTPAGARRGDVAGGNGMKAADVRRSLQGAQGRRDPGLPAPPRSSRGDRSPASLRRTDVLPRA